MFMLDGRTNAAPWHKLSWPLAWWATCKKLEPWSRVQRSFHGIIKEILYFQILTKKNLWIRWLVFDTFFAKQWLHKYYIRKFTISKCCAIFFNTNLFVSCVYNADEMYMCLLLLQGGSWNKCYCHVMLHFIGPQKSDLLDRGWLIGRENGLCWIIHYFGPMK